MNNQAINRLLTDMRQANRRAIFLPGTESIPAYNFQAELDKHIPECKPVTDNQSEVPHDQQHQTTHP